MKIAILGAGALGCYYGARLAEAGMDVSFIMRSDYDEVKEHGLNVKSVHGDINLPHPSVFKSSRDVGEADLVIVTWKTTSNGQLAASLPPLLKPGTIVLTLQNGMGNAEAISSIVPPGNVYVGLCFICAMRERAGQISHLEGGDIQFAPYIFSEENERQAESLAQLFAAAKIQTRSFGQAEQIQWYKLVWNIPFNGLCLAKGGINIEELYRDPANVSRARQIMEEVVASAKARGYSLPGTLVDFQMKRTENMGAFTPSSAVDYNMHRPVEYDAIWGIPLQKAREAGAHIPEWEQLDREIRARLGLQPSPAP